MMIVKSLKHLILYSWMWWFDLFLLYSFRYHNTNLWPILYHLILLLPVHKEMVCGAKYHTTHVVGVPLKSPQCIHNAPVNRYTHHLWSSVSHRAKYHTKHVVGYL